MHFVIAVVETPLQCVSTHVCCAVGREKIVAMLSKINVQYSESKRSSQSSVLYAFVHQAERQPVRNVCVLVAHRSGYLFTLGLF